MAERFPTGNSTFDPIFSSRIALYAKGGGNVLPVYETLLNANERIREIYWVLREELDNERA